MGQFDYFENPAWLNAQEDEQPYPCAVCEKLIWSCELCEECAKGNDPFDIDPDKHEHRPGDPQ